MALALNDIQELKNRVTGGGDITYEEAIRLMEVDEISGLDELLKAAHEITHAFHSTKAGLCSLINAKSYLCGEDCGFCAQSVRFETSAARYELLEPEVIVEAAKKAELQGAQNFCIVTSGGALTDDEVERILGGVKQLTHETHL